MGFKANLTAAGVGGFAGSMLAGHLHERKTWKGPGWISTIFWLVVSLITGVTVPGIGAFVHLYATNRMTRRLGQYEDYAVSNAECVRFARSNETVWVMGCLIVFGVVSQMRHMEGLLGNIAYGGFLLLWFGTLGLAVKNGLAINRELKAEVEGVA